MTNSAIITKNEARAEIRLPDHTEDFADSLILPANIAGSATDSTIGGAPTKPKDGE